MSRAFGIASSILLASFSAEAALLTLTDASLSQRNADFSATYQNFFSSFGDGLNSPVLANGCVAETNASGPTLQISGFGQYSYENTNIVNVQRAPLGAGTCYLTTVGYPSTYVIDFGLFRSGGRKINAFGFLWGSFDHYNSIELLDINSAPLNIVGLGPSFFDGTDLARYTGATLFTDRYINFRFGPAEDFRFAVFRTTNTAFEIDNIRIQDDRFGPIITSATVASPLVSVARVAAPPSATLFGLTALLAALGLARPGRARRSRA